MKNRRKCIAVWQIMWPVVNGSLTHLNTYTNSLPLALLYFICLSIFRFKNCAIIIKCNCQMRKQNNQPNNVWQCFSACWDDKTLMLIRHMLFSVFFLLHIWWYTYFGLCVGCYTHINTRTYANACIHTTIYSLWPISCV